MDIATKCVEYIKREEHLNDITLMAFNDVAICGHNDDRPSLKDANVVFYTSCPCIHCFMYNIIAYAAEDKAASVHIALVAPKNDQFRIDEFMKYIIKFNKYRHYANTTTIGQRERYLKEIMRIHDGILPRGFNDMLNSIKINIFDKDGVKML